MGVIKVHGCVGSSTGVVALYKVSREEFEQVACCWHRIINYKSQSSTRLGRTSCPVLKTTSLIEEL